MLQNNTKGIYLPKKMHRYPRMTMNTKKNRSLLHTERDSLTHGVLQYEKHGLILGLAGVYIKLNITKKKLENKSLTGYFIHREKCFDKAHT